VLIVYEEVNIGNTRKSGKLLDKLNRLEGLSEETFSAVKNLEPNTTHAGYTENGVMIINTSRGGLIDTAALIKGLKRH
jgi:hypothetical protein